MISKTLKIGKYLNLVLFIGVATLFFTTGCTSSGENENKDPEQAEIETEDSDDDISININDEEINLKGLQDAMKNVEKAFSENADGEKVEVVDFRELKELLPENLIGMERTSHTGEKSGGFGIKVSTAKAKYEEDDKEMKIEITDTGGFGFAKMGLAAFNSVEIDKETDHGYEKTYTEDGIKYYEEFDSRYNSGSLKAFIKERFFVDIEGDGLEMNDFKKAIKKLKLNQLNKY